MIERCRCFMWNRYLMTCLSTFSYLGPESTDVYVPDSHQKKQALAALHTLYGMKVKKEGLVFI